MLKERLITAIVLFVVFTGLIAFASVSLFSFVLGLIVAAATWEWGRLCGITHEHAQSAVAIVGGAITIIALNSPLVDVAIPAMMMLGLLFWLCVPIQFYLKPLLSPITEISYGWLVVGLIVVPIAALAMQYLRSYAPGASAWLLLYPLSVVWVMDIGAYFAGRKYGKRKLAPLISPGKSWEGVYGGLACSFVLFRGMVVCWIVLMVLLRLCPCSRFSGYGCDPNPIGGNPGLHRLNWKKYPRRYQPTP